MKFWKLALITCALLILILIGTRIIPKSDSDQGHVHSEDETHQADTGHIDDENDEHEKDVTTGGIQALETAGHSEDNGHDHNEPVEESIVHLSEDNIVKFGIEIEMAGPGELEIRRTVPGEIVINADRLAHIVPRVSGVVTNVKSKLGDSVKMGQVMASVVSRELADAKASYLASIERFELAEAIFLREEKLRREKISSEQDYLDASKDRAEARIEMRSTEQKLRALGFNSEYLDHLPSESADMFTVFDIRAPFDGTIIKKHITMGETITAEENVFVVADLETVWANLHIQQSDIGLIEENQMVKITSKSGMRTVYGTISYIDRIIDEGTRTSLARVVLDNVSGKLRPGKFITGDILITEHFAEVMVPRSTLQSINDDLCVFVKDEHGFELRHVTTGYSNDEFVEILAGLNPGELIVTKNNFSLKAELEKGENFGQACQDHAH